MSKVVIVVMNESLEGTKLSSLVNAEYRHELVEYGNRSMTFIPVYPTLNHENFVSKVMVEAWYVVRSVVEGDTIHIWVTSDVGKVTMQDIAKEQARGMFSINS